MTTQSNSNNPNLMQNYQTINRNIFQISNQHSCYCPDDTSDPIQLDERLPNFSKSMTDKSHISNLFDTLCNKSLSNRTSSLAESSFNNRICDGGSGTTEHSDEFISNHKLNISNILKSIHDDVLCSDEDNLPNFQCSYNQNSMIDPNYKNFYFNNLNSSTNLQNYPILSSNNMNYFKENSNPLVINLLKQKHRKQIDNLKQINCENGDDDDDNNNLKNSTESLGALIEPPQSFRESVNELKLWNMECLKEIEKPPPKMPPLRGLFISPNPKPNPI